MGSITGWMPPPRPLDFLKAAPHVENTGCIAFFHFEKKKKKGKIGLQNISGPEELSACTQVTLETRLDSVRGGSGEHPAGKQEHVLRVLPRALRARSVYPTRCSLSVRTRWAQPVASVGRCAVLVPARPLIHILLGSSGRGRHFS